LTYIWRLTFLTKSGQRLANAMAHSKQQLEALVTETSLKLPEYPKLQILVSISRIAVSAKKCFRANNSYEPGS
jgi:hypothetical protein